MADEVNADRENIGYIFENMVFGDDKRDLSLAWKWIHEHPKLTCWISGHYWGLDAPASCYDYGYAGKVEGLPCDIGTFNGKYFSEAVTSAGRVLSDWMKVHLRQDILYKLCRVLQSKRKLFMQLCRLTDEEFDLIIDYFNFYSDLPIKLWSFDSVGVVFIILSSTTPSWVLAMQVASALSAGCSVIISPSPKACFFSFLLAEACKEAGLLEGTINVVPSTEDFHAEIFSLGVQKIVFNGYLKADTIFDSNITNLSVLTPNHTALILLESCDIQGAVDKLCSETWQTEAGFQSSSIFWGIDTVVVQESIFQHFIRIFTDKINNSSVKFTENVNVMNKKLLKAKQIGAKPLELSRSDAALVPVMISQHRVDFGDTFSMTIMVCRTADEGINIVNNSPYCLGTSVWTENYAQALEVASRLETSIVWINCHGIIDATIPFEPSHKSGMGCFGGLEGGLANKSLKMHKTEHSENNTVEGNLNLESMCKVIQTCTKSLAKWEMEKDRRKYLKGIVDYLKAKEDLCIYASDVNYWAHNGNSYEVVKGCKRPDLYTLQNKKPVGVVAIVLNDSSDIVKSFSNFVSAAIAVGNVVIVVIRQEHISILKPLVESYCRNLPVGVVNILEGMEYAPDLAADPNVQAIYVCTERDDLLPEIEKLKNVAWKYFKRFWVQSYESTLKSTYSSILLKEQTIFLPKINNCA